MPAPIITNPYDNDNLLSAYVGEPFSAKIAIANMSDPPRLSVTGNWVRLGYRWLAAENSVELLMTPTRLLKELLITDEDTGIVLETSGIRLEAINNDGSDLAMIPFEFIHREPIIDDIPIQEFRRGQTGVDYNIGLQHSPNVVAVRGDLLGLDHESSPEGVRIFGDIVDGDLTKPTGTYTVDAANQTGAAPQKTGRWGIPGLPYQPTGVIATAQDRGLRIRWNEILSYPDLTETHIRIATTQNGLNTATWTKLSQADATEHTYTALTNGTPHYVQVRGRNTRGYSPVSDAISGTPQAVAAIPAAPENVALASRNTALIVTWRIPYVFPALSKIEIRWATSQAALASATWTDIGSATAVTHTIPNLTNGTTYYVQVRLVNSEGNGTASAAITGTPNPVPAIPAAPSGVSLTAKDKSIAVNWTLPIAFPALSKQQIRYADSEAGLANATWTDLAADATTYTIDTLINGTTYFVQLRGVNSVGDGTVSQAVSARPTGVPHEPTGVSAVGDDKKMTVNWTLPIAFPALSKQEIRWADSEAGLATATWTDVGSTTATTYDITGLTNDKLHYAQVRGVNSEGNGIVSATVSATPTEIKVTGAPGIPHSINYDTTTDTVTITWTAGSNSHPVTIYELDFDRRVGQHELSDVKVTGLTSYTTPSLSGSGLRAWILRIRAINPTADGEKASGWSTTRLIIFAG